MANVKKLKINNTSYDIAVSSVEKVEGLNEALEAKQDVISDLDEIRSGAALGSTSIQPGDNISELNNDSEYQTETQLNSAISAHNTSDTAHSDIRTTLGNKQDKTDNTLTTTSKTIVGAINELDTRPSAPAIDNKTITKNTSDQLQTVAVIDQSNTNNILKEWSGTESAYQALSVKDSNTIYYTY